MRLSGKHVFTNIRLVWRGEFCSDIISPYLQDSPLLHWYIIHVYRMHNFLRNSQFSETQASFAHQCQPVLTNHLHNFAPRLIHIKLKSCPTMIFLEEEIRNFPHDVQVHPCQWYWRLWASLPFFCQLVSLCLSLHCSHIYTFLTACKCEDGMMLKMKMMMGIWIGQGLRGLWPWTLALTLSFARYMMYENLVPLRPLCLFDFKKTELTKARICCWQKRDYTQ